MDRNAGWFTGRPPAIETPGNKAEVMVRQIGDDFYESLDGISSDFIKVVKREANARGIDPLYVFYALFDKPKLWKRVVGKNWRALHLVRDVARAWSNDIPDWSSFAFPGPGKQKDADEVFKAVARWAATEWSTKALRLYIDATRKQQKVADYYIKTQYGKQIDGKKVLCWLDGQVRETLDKKPRLWPRYHQLLWGFITNLFASKGLSCPA
ncbi:hypothetical protein N9917_01310 [Deltaproteobacteria bacterium]|nr:hypothetical protein [Deltaproteobacteria bacterium]